MPRFVAFFNYTPATWAALLARPTDRTEAVRTLVENAGGTVDTLYYTLGEPGGLVLFDAPDTATATAITLVSGSSPGTAFIRTVEVVPADRFVDVLTAGARVADTFRRPGE